MDFRQNSIVEDHRQAVEPISCGRTRPACTCLLLAVISIFIFNNLHSMSQNRRPWSWSLYFLSQLIYLLGLSTNLRPFLPRWLFFVAFASICVYLVRFTSFRSPVDNYGFPSYLFTVFFDAMDFLVLRDPQKEIRMEGQKLGEIENEPFIKRLKWSIELMVSQRGLGWIDPLAPKVPRIPPAPTQRRKALVLTKLRELVFNVIMFDLVGILNRANPSFKRDGPPVGEGRTVASFLWRLELMLGFAAAQYLILTTLHCVYCIVSVGFGLSEPRHWPSLFGSALEAYTIRRHWGYTWHQFMYRLLMSHSKFLIGKLGLSPGSTLSSCIRLLLSFFISGFIHACGDLMVFRDWSTGGSFTFFMLQPLGIAVETAVIVVFRRMGVQIDWRISRAVGFVWVVLWFSYTMPLLLEPLLRVGFFESGPSFSLILGIRRGEWIPKV